MIFSGTYSSSRKLSLRKSLFKKTHTNYFQIIGKLKILFTTLCIDTKQNSGIHFKTFILMKEVDPVKWMVIALTTISESECQDQQQARTWAPCHSTAEMLKEELWKHRCLVLAITFHSVL